MPVNPLVERLMREGAGSDGAAPMGTTAPGGADWMAELASKLAGGVKVTPGSPGSPAKAGAPAGGAPVNYASGDPRAIARQMAQARGWTGAQWDALERLVQKESSWRPNIKNPTSSAWGLFQFLDMHKKPGGYLPHGNNSTIQQQIEGGLRYIADRYGDPYKALQFHLRNNWY